MLFPFGRGCPSDKNSKLSDIRLHSQKMLKKGGGPNPRRFQQSPNYYFTVYSYLMKQKIGGIAALAQKHNLDGTALPENLPTVGEINDLLDYLGDTTTNEEVERIESESKSDGQSTYDMDKIKKLISRLVPYSRHAQGTKMGIRYEKRNLLALIPSPIINATGYWRWFIMFAPADLYDHRLYEILMITDDDNLKWDEKKQLVSNAIYLMCEYSISTVQQ
jgi:hypothetical protein